ncbi:hypothetical protein [Flagellimonas olearia]|nr:hypothetical protein [Allomuricauda olearia]
MNRLSPTEILEDFVVFLLLQEDELLSPIGYFFNQENMVMLFDGKEKTNYLDYIRQELGFLEKLKINPQLKPTIESLDDLLSKNEQQSLLKTINENFKFGFPTDCDEEGNPLDGSYNLNISPFELDETFQLYLALSKINPSIYISYVHQIFVHQWQIQHRALEENITRFNDVLLSRQLIPSNIKEDFQKNRLLKSKNKYFNVVEEKPFQFDGFFDSKGYFIDLEKTVTLWIELSKRFKLSYDILLLKVPSDCSLMLYKYHKALLGENESEESSLSESFYEQIERNKPLVNYLKDKGFDNNEIYIVINLLSFNDFNNLNIRYIDFNSVEFFRLCYLFYIFDFYEEDKSLSFETENDFLYLSLSSPPTNLKRWKNQFKKYYSNKYEVESTDYPFKKADILLNKIENQLQIKREKLKPILKR